MEQLPMAVVVAPAEMLAVQQWQVAPAAAVLLVMVVIMAKILFRLRRR
jgi:hypothetical protein